MTNCHNITGSFNQRNSKIGWLEWHSLNYLFYLCGNDCWIRYENNMITVAEIEAQAAGNLRNSFSVVGLLHESTSFFEMIHKRIDYVDMNKEMTISKDQRHSSGNGQTQIDCKNLYATNVEFRERVRLTVPTFAALERVYNIGVEVNRFQKEELRQY